jgi:hypothetical protein
VAGGFTGRLILDDTCLVAWVIFMGNADACENLPVFGHTVTEIAIEPASRCL